MKKRPLENGRKGGVTNSYVEPNQLGSCRTKESKPVETKDTSGEGWEGGAALYHITSSAPDEN